MEMKSLKKIMALVLLISSLPGVACASNNHAANVPRATPQTTTQPQTETRVYLRKQCLLSETKVDVSRSGFIGALAGIFVPLLIGKALTGISQALRKAGSPQTLSDTGRFPTYLYQLTKQGSQTSLTPNPNLKCVIVVRGAFSGSDHNNQTVVSFPEDGIFLKPTEEEEAKRIKRLNECNIPVSKIAVVVEAAVILSDDGTAMYYENRFLEVNEFQGKRSSDNRALVVSIAINGAGTKQGDESRSLALLNLGEVKKGTIGGPEQLRGHRNSWLGGIGLSKSAQTSLETLKAKLSDGESAGVDPVTVEATLAETEDGNKALVFIADVLDATKTSLANTISDEVLPAKREERAEAEASALETALTAEETTFASYLTALNALARLDANAATTERAIKEFDVKKTKRAWCRKFEALSSSGLQPDRSPHSCP